MIARVVFLALISAALGLGIGSVRPNTVNFPPSYVQTLRPVGSKILVTNYQTLPIDFPQAFDNPLAYVVAISEDLEGEIEYITSPQQQVYADYSRNRDDISSAQRNFLQVGDIVMLNNRGSFDPCRVPVTINQETTSERLANYCLLQDWENQILGIVNIGQQHINAFPFLDASPTDDGLVAGVIGGVAGVASVNGGTANVISINDVEVVEGDAGTTETPEIIFRLSEVTTRLVTVVILTEGGTATEGDDWLTPPRIGQTLVATIDPGLQQESIRLRIRGDTIPEGIETFSMRIVSADGAIISPTHNVGTITIIDDDTPAVVSVEVEAASASVAEPILPATASIRYTFTLDRPLNAVTNINYQLSGFGPSPATVPPAADADITNGSGASGTISFPAQSVSQTLVIGVREDFLPEFDETLRVTITGTPQSVTIDPNRATADATITSADQATISFPANPIAPVPESAASITIPISLINPLNSAIVPLPIQTTITFTYSVPPANGATAIPGTDYVETASLIIPANTVGTTNLVIQLLNNDASADTETGVVSIGSSSAIQFTNLPGTNTFNFQIVNTL